MRKNLVDVHIFWEGPFSLNDVRGKTDWNKDYGIYQIYGHHPIYGSDVLLYIGSATARPFGVRIPEEGWNDRPDSENTQIYLGRLGGEKNIGEDDSGRERWDELIICAEKLLIYSHKPVFNTQNTKSLPEEGVLGIHIFNWWQHRDLFPEVSGSRFTSKFEGLYGAESGEACIYKMTSSAHELQS